MKALGGNVVSMAERASDILTVLWLWKWSELTDGGDPRESRIYVLPIVPLFETIADFTSGTGNTRRRARSRRVSRMGSRTWRSTDRDDRLFGRHQGWRLPGRVLAPAELPRRSCMPSRKAAAVKLTFFHGRGGRWVEAVDRPPTICRCPRDVRWLVAAHRTGGNPG